MAAADTILREIINRVDSEPAYFLHDEVAQWPAGLLGDLIEQGLLSEAQRMLRVRCQGCERDCIMDVEIVRAKGKRPMRVLIACDKEQDIGLVSVDPERLRRWQATTAQLGAVVAKLLGVDDFQPNQSTSGPIRLGKVKGSKQRAELTMATESPVSLNIASHSLPLFEVLYLDNNRICIERDAITGLIDHPATANSGKSYEFSTVKREARKLDTQARNRTLQKNARELRKQHPRKSERWIAKRIENSGIAGNLNLETIRKIIRTK